MHEECVLNSILSDTSNKLRGSDIAFGFSEIPFLTGINFQLQSGELLHVQGENGVGKTTLLRIASGLLFPKAGAVFWNDNLLTAQATEFSECVLYLGHANGLLPQLTVKENLLFLYALHGLDRSGLSMSVLEKALKFFHLQAQKDIPVSFLSAGQKRRVALARLITEEKILWILDEPFTALDVQGAALLLRLMDVHRKHGGMTMLSAHHALELEGTHTLKLGL